MLRAVVTWAGSVATLFTVTYLLSKVLPGGAPGWLVNLCYGILFFTMPVAIGAAVLVLLDLLRGSKPGVTLYTALSPEAQLRDLEARGLVTTTAYRARRAFHVQELEDEGTHYYLELEDGSVLFLSGQYLYDYEPEEKRGKVTRARRFPCTEFTFREHRTEHYGIDLLHCGGTVLEPEVSAPPFNDEDFERDLYPGDGAVIRNRTYDELKAERQRRAPH